MSTILKALKKAESDSISGDHDAGEATSPQPRERGSGDRVRSKWQGAYLFIPIFVLLAGVGIWRYLTPPDSPPQKLPEQTFPIATEPSDQETSDQKSSDQETSMQAEAGAKPQLNTDKSPVHPAPAIDSGKQPARQERADKAAKPDIDQKPAATVGNDAPEPPSNRDDSQESPEKRRHAENTIKESPVAEKAASIKPKSNRAEDWRDAKRLENDRMMLQAVAWAPRPEKRMGVIDGQVVREGDDANGYTVVKIRKRNIILQRDGQYFRLEFQGK